MYRDYITGQPVLVLNLDFIISKNHPVHAISQFVKSTPQAVLEGDPSATGYLAHILKILLFIYSCNVFSGRKMTVQC